jgi:hypothetical protein
VSSSLGDDANPGTRERPARTFQRAIALARSGPKRVYACAEVFAEAAVVPSGVEVWGGLDCGQDWLYLGGDHRTVLAPEPDLVPLRVELGEDGGLSMLADLRLNAADAILPGGSAIAMMVLSGAAVELRRSELLAGDGADGAPGQRGGEVPAKGGTPGASGAAACSADAVVGGHSITTVCDDGHTIGGKGGDGNITTGAAGNDGQPEPVPNPIGFGLGGTGENGFACTTGEVGAPGPDGSHGLGARGDGARISIDGWEGQKGEDGGNGLPGQGGGGGGGSRGGSLYCGAGPKGGASGGSGGGGGCGGRGGQGGGFGGASIGLLTFSRDVSVFSTSIVTGNGGDGGAGGLAQVGGAQGAPGIGGSSVGASHPGCWGGLGGKGGSGGYGGGGLGGPSLGVAHLHGQPPALHDSPIRTSVPGKGGPGGNQYVPDSAGEDGMKADTLAIPQ